MSAWRIDLPITSPLSLNDRVNRYKRAGEVKRLRAATKVLARNVHHIPRCDRIEVELHWQPNTRRNRDGDNPIPTVKACVDGLRDAGVIEDDDTSKVTHLPVVIHTPARARHGRLWLEIRSVPAGWTHIREAKELGRCD